MSNNPTILVAADAVDDADLVASLLADEFPGVAKSTDPSRALTDFELHRPRVLILAFDTLDRAQGYYLGLFRRSAAIHTVAHRTLVLCNKEELRQAYELCRKEHFDDYILFWPLSHDAPRLLMAVHQALRHVAATEGMASRGEFALQVRRLADTESTLERLTAEGARRIDSAEQSLRRVQDVHRATPDGSSPQAAHARTSLPVRGGDPGLKIASFSSRRIPSPLDPVEDALKPVRQWAESLPHQLAPQLQAARALRELASQVRPLLLLVEDDEFQLKLLQNLLGSGDYELMTASSGATAIASLRRRRPDMMLVDIGLPDIDGLELVRFIKGIPAFAPITVIMITGRSDKESVVASIKTGAAGYVVKPLSRDVLLRKVAECLVLPSPGPVSDSPGDISQDAPS